MKLKQARQVQLFFCFYVDKVRFFWGFVDPQINKFAIYADSCLKLSFSFANTKQSCGAARTYVDSILAVFCRSYVTQICYSVVVFYPVYMVNLACRPCSVNIKPRKPVRSEISVIDSDFDISILVVPAAIRSAHCVPVAVNDPSKLSGFRAVRQKFLEPNNCDDRILCSHFVAPVKQWIGERLGSIGSAFGPRFIIAEAH